MAVDALDRRRPVSVDCLGLGGAHALPPVRYYLRVAWSGFVAIARRVSWLADWRENGRSATGGFLDLVDGGEPPVGEVFVRNLAVPLVELVEHWGHLGLV